MDRRSFLIQGVMTMLAIPLIPTCKQEEDPPEQEARYGQTILTELSDIPYSQELLQDSVVGLSDGVTCTWVETVVRDLDRKIIS